MKRFSFAYVFVILTCYFNLEWHYKHSDLFILVRLKLRSRLTYWAQNFKKNHKKGDVIKSEDLRLARENRSIPSNAISKLDGIAGLYLQRDVVKGELLLRNDLKKAVKVFVAQKALPAGIPINDSNFVQKKITHAVPSDYIEKLSGLEYMTTNKRIDVGKVLRERDLRKAKLVRRNEPVNLIYKTENFSIDAKGVSLSDGYFGSRIKAKNLESSLIVSGTVVDYGTISVN